MSFAFPAIGQPVTVTDNLGNVTHLRYDAEGNTVAVTDAVGNTTDFGNTSGLSGYNIANQPVLVTLPATGQGAGNATVVTTYSYPGGPRIASTVYDENGNQVRHVTTGYGHEDELVSRGGDTDNVTYAYDGMYRVTSLTDGNAHATNYYYNHTGFLYGMTYPGYTGATASLNGTTGDWSGVSGKDSVVYAGWDNLGNPATRTDGNGAATTYAYADPESRLSKITYPTGTLPVTTIGYDSYGRLSSVGNGTTVTSAGYTNGGTTYAGYDDDDNALNVQTTFLASDHSTTLFNAALSYAYNPDGSRAALGTPAGTFSYAYDNDDRLSTLTNPFSEQSAWQYDNDSRLQSQTLSNGIVSSYAYNARSFLTDLLNKGGSTTLSEFGGSTQSTAMTYDALGDVASVKASLPAAPSAYSGTTSYQYDGKTELTQEASTRSGGYTNADSYDLAENPTQVRGVAQPTATADNQIPVSGVTFDGNGNPSKVEGLTAAFDIENRATALGGVSNAWGGNGLRASKTASGGTTYFLYDGSVPVCELSSSGSVTATNTFGGAGLISRRSGSASTFYTFDAQGNVAQRYTSTGSLVSSDLYDAFGKGTSTGSGDVFAYEGQFGYYTDAATGLILCGHRFYDSAAGRFITRDPISYDGGVNLYGYTKNNPTNLVDPFGEDPPHIVYPVLGGAGIGATAVAIALFIPGLNIGIGAALVIGAVGGIVGGVIAGQLDPSGGADPVSDAIIGGVSGAVAGGATFLIGGPPKDPLDPGPPSIPVRPFPWFPKLPPIAGPDEPLPEPEFPYSGLPGALGLLPGMSPPSGTQSPC